MRRQRLPQGVLGEHVAQVVDSGARIDGSGQVHILGQVLNQTAGGAGDLLMFTVVEGQVLFHTRRQ